MKTNKKIIAASVALMLCASYGVFAAQKPVEYHEDQWGNVLSYGSTPIASDSVAEWGPWADFVQPAAGGPAIGFLPQGVGEVYRPLPQPVTPIVTDNFCQAGEWCGYADYINQTKGKQGSTDVGDIPGRIGVKLSPSSGSAGMVSYRLEGLAGEPAPLHASSGDLNAYFGYPAVGSFDAFNRFIGIDGGEGNTSDPLYYDPNHVTHGDFNLVQYMSGGGESGLYQTSTFGSYVAGIVTPMTDIAVLQAGNVQANYTGYTVYPHSGRNVYGTSPVAIAVNFGNSTWTGSWNNGVDGYVETQGADSAGTAHLYGQVGFNASGKIVGANIISDSVTTKDPGATISGKVQGSFFGPQAAALAGVSDVTKSNPSQGYENVRNVDLFITQRVKTGTATPASLPK